MITPSLGPTLSYAGAGVLAKPVAAPVPPAIAKPGTKANPYQLGYANLVQQDTAELLLVSLGTPQAAFDNVTSVLAQAAALQRARQPLAKTGLYSYKNDTSPYDVLNLPTIEAQIGKSNDVAYAAIDRAIKGGFHGGRGFSFDLTA